jgi:hypothetical protein
MEWSSWRDWLTITGWLIGLASFVWGVKQTGEARNAKRAEADTRALLHRRRVVQQLLGLAEGALSIHTRLESSERLGLQDDAMRLAADLSRATSFFGNTLPGTVNEQMESARTSLGGALSLIMEKGERQFEDSEKQQIRRFCLDASLSLHSLRGHMEMLEELGLTPLRKEK